MDKCKNVEIKIDIDTTDVDKAQKKVDKLNRTYSELEKLGIVYRRRWYQFWK